MVKRYFHAHICIDFKGKIFPLKTRIQKLLFTDDFKVPETSGIFVKEEGKQPILYDLKSLMEKFTHDVFMIKPKVCLACLEFTTFSKNKRLLEITLYSHTFKNIELFANKIINFTNDNEKFLYDKYGVTDVNADF